MRFIIRIAAVTVCSLIGLWAPATGQQPEGKYDVIGPVPALHSLDAVVLEEYLNFTCPHCNNFRKAAKSVYAKYGKRLKTENIPILFRGQPDTPLRLYFIAERAGRTEEIKEILFDATFVHGVNIYDPQVVSYLARSAGLAAEFRREFNAGWVTRKIKIANERANKAGVQATPTIVLNGSIRMTPRTGMNEFVGTLDRVISQLLK